MKDIFYLLVLALSCNVIFIAFNQMGNIGNEELFKGCQHLLQKKMMNSLFCSSKNQSNSPIFILLSAYKAKNITLNESK